MLQLFKTAQQNNQKEHETFLIIFVAGFAESKSLYPQKIYISSFWKPEYFSENLHLFYVKDFDIFCYLN